MVSESNEHVEEVYDWEVTEKEENVIVGLDLEVKVNDENDSELEITEDVKNVMKVEIEVRIDEENDSKLEVTEKEEK